MSTERPILLVVAASGRVLAQSARAAGYAVRIFDAFGDQDTRACGPWRQLPLVGSQLDAAAVEAEAQACLERCRRGGREVAGIVLGGGLEASPDTVAWLERSVPLYGNRAHVVRTLLDPNALLSLLAELGVRHPEAQVLPPASPCDAPWLLKALGSSGGLGVRDWEGSSPLPSGPHYFQRRLAGIPASLLFLADGCAVRPVGLNRLLPADHVDARPFLYGGAISGLPIAPDHARLVERWARQLTSALGLRGLNGLDFLLTDDGPQLLELNARPTATLALYEPSAARALVLDHIDACEGRLPVSLVRTDSSVRGQRVVYAPRDLRISARWSWPVWTGDRPYPGTRVPRGAPLCTVAAEGASPAEAEAMLHGRHRWLLGQLDGEEASVSVIEETS